jgi:hypothetical protein
MTEQLTVVAHLRALNGQIEETKAVLDQNPDALWSPKPG